MTGQDGLRLKCSWSFKIKLRISRDILSGDNVEKEIVLSFDLLHNVAVAGLVLSRQQSLGNKNKAKSTAKEAERSSDLDCHNSPNYYLYTRTYLIRVSR